MRRLQLVGDGGAGGGAAAGSVVVVSPAPAGSPVSPAVFASSVLLSSAFFASAGLAAACGLGGVVVFGAGLGVPFFSTDSCAAQRALEINADIVLMAKGVDGVYDSDPKSNPNAKKFDLLTHHDVLTRGLKVADATAISLCQDNSLPIQVFNLLVDGNIARAVRGEKIGTLITTGSNT